MSFKTFLLKAFLHVYKMTRSSNKNDIIKTVAVISNTAIGDTLMATPVIRALKGLEPKTKIVAVLNPENAALFTTNPNINEVVLFGGRWRGFLGAVRKLEELNIDAALLLHSNEPQATPLAVLSGAKTIIKIPNDKSPFSSFHTNPKIASKNDRHGIYDRLEQLSFLGIESSDVSMELFLKDEWLLEAKEFLDVHGCKDSILVGFQIGASTKSRMWFEERWAELAKMLLATVPNIRILLTGSPKERAQTQKIKNMIPDERVINAAGALSIGGAAALIKEVGVFVTPDTGPMHIAIALRTPSVALFAVADPIKSGAAYDKEIHVQIKKPRTCDPCVSKLCKYQKCMLQIEATEVFSEVLKMLEV